jgi:hypothetical protein
VVENLLPRDTLRSFALKVVEAPVEFFALSRRKRDRLRRLAKAVPKLVQELEAFFGTQIVEIQSALFHSVSISRAARPHAGG